MSSSRVWCCQCGYFIADPAGDGLGIGACQQYEQYKQKNPSDRALLNAFKKLGGKLFWGGNGGSGRLCVKFLRKG